MALHVLLEDRFSEKMKALLDSFLYYSDGLSTIVVLSEHTVILIRGVSTVEEAIEVARANLAAVLGSPPDFETMTMDNGAGMVGLRYGNVLVHVAPDVMDGAEAVTFPVALEYREIGLHDCENGEIFAVYLSEKDETVRTTG